MNSLLGAPGGINPWNRPKKPFPPGGGVGGFLAQTPPGVGVARGDILITFFIFISISGF